MNKVRLKAVSSTALLGVLFAAVIYALLSDELVAVQQLKDDYSRKLVLLERLEELPKREDALLKKFEAMSEEQAGRLLYSGDANAINTYLQRDLRTIASRNNVSISAMRAIGSRRGDAYLEKTVIQLNFGAEHNRLIAFLKDLEEWEPIIRVQRGSLIVRQKSEDTSDAELNIVLEVVAFSQGAKV